METSEFKPLATLHGKRTKKTYKFLWNTENHCVYIEEKSTFGFPKKVKTSITASSWEMAYHAAEAYVFEK